MHVTSIARVHAGLRQLQLDANVNIQERRLFIFSLCLNHIYAIENLEVFCLSRKTSCECLDVNMYVMYLQ